MDCWFGRCHIESRSGSSCCFNISNRKIWSGFRSRRRNSKITKRVHAVLKSSARLVTRISISPAKIDPSGLPARTSAAEALAEIETINAQMRREHLDNYSQDNSFGGDVLSLQDLAVAGMRPALLILLGAVFLVLLIACANLTTMLLARAAAREREIAIRVALGAGRMRLLKQVFTESVLLALIGGAAGVLLALWGVELLKTIGAQTVPRLHEVNIDLVVLGVTLAICVGTGIIFGLVPGLASSRPELTEALKEDGRGSTVGTRRNRLRNGLVIAEIALALVLLSGAGLLIKSFVRLQNVNPGFNPRNALTF